MTKAAARAIPAVAISRAAITSRNDAPPAAATTAVGSETPKATQRLRAEAGMSARVKAAILATRKAAPIPARMNGEAADGATSNARERTTTTSGAGTAVGSAIRKGIPRRRAAAGSIGGKDRTIGLNPKNEEARMA